MNSKRNFTGFSLSGPLLDVNILSTQKSISETTNTNWKKKHFTGMSLTNVAKKTCYAKFKGKSFKSFIELCKK